MATGIRTTIKRSPFRLYHANIIVFLLIFLTGAGIFGVQMHWLKRTFINDVKDHARLAADIVLLNTRHAILSRTVMDDILSGLMGNSARFINYLESVEPFSSDELAAFAEESGFAGAGILRSDGIKVEGPQDWLRHDIAKRCSSERLLHFPLDHLTVYCYPDKQSGDIIYVGLKTENLEKLQQRIGVENTLREISALHGIAYAKFIKKRSDGTKITERIISANTTAQLKSDENKRPVVEVQIPVHNGTLVIAMDAAPLYKTRKRMAHYFMFFSVLLFSLGAVLTTVLYKYQQAYMENVRSFERRLAAEREEAALGRAAAGIAHEIRNPLNSVAIGLQRMGMNHDGSSHSSRQLIQLMLHEIRRADRIISGMLTYSRPVTVSYKRTNIADIVREQLEIAQPGFDERGITVISNITDTFINGDPDLLRQLVSNLINNAREALADGGEMEVRLWKEGDHIFLQVINPFSGEEMSEIDRIFEPYFTTRLSGTGLGLAICKRIVDAHSGRIDAKIENGRFIITAVLPARGEK